MPFLDRAGAQGDEDHGEDERDGEPDDYAEPPGRLYAEVAQPEEVERLRPDEVDEQRADGAADEGAAEDGDAATLQERRAGAALSLDDAVADTEDEGAREHADAGPRRVERRRRAEELRDDDDAQDDQDEPVGGAELEPALAGEVLALDAAGGEHREGDEECEADRHRPGGADHHREVRQVVRRCGRHDAAGDGSGDDRGDHYRAGTPDQKQRAERPAVDALAEHRPQDEPVEPDPDDRADADPGVGELPLCHLCDGGRNRQQAEEDGQHDPVHHAVTRRALAPLGLPAGDAGDDDTEDDRAADPGGQPDFGEPLPTAAPRYRM